MECLTSLSSLFHKCVMEIGISKAIGPYNILVINVWISKINVSWRSFGISLTKY